MVLTIKNFESQNVWPWVTETAPTNLVWVAGTLKATLTWTSATGESWVTWTEEKLVRKEWSAPQWSMDWTTVATITTKDTYATNWYEDTGLDSTKTYYYKVFAVYDNGTERGSSDVNVTPQHPAPIIIESDLTTSTLASLQADGWTGIDSNGTYILNNTGLRPVQKTHWHANLYKDLSDIHYEIDNIELEINSYGVSWSMSWFYHTQMGDVVTGNANYEITGRLDYSTNSGYAGWSFIYKPPQTTVGSWTNSNPTGEYKIKQKFNLKTWEIDFKVFSGWTLYKEFNSTIPSDKLSQIVEHLVIVKAGIAASSSNWYNNSIKYAKLTITF